MIAPRFLPRDVWEPRLRQYKCVPLQGLGRLNTAEWWRATWTRNYLFTVPVEDDGSCHQGAFQRLVAQLMKHAPPGTRFDDD
jgi:hypothetical protein